MTDDSVRNDPEQRRLLVHGFVGWQLGQGSAGRFFCWSLLGSVMCHKLSGGLVESGGQYSHALMPGVGLGCQGDLSVLVISRPPGGQPGFLVSEF